MTELALHDYRTGDFIRHASLPEYLASLQAAETDGGRGVIEIDGRSYFVLFA